MLSKLKSALYLWFDDGHLTHVSLNFIEKAIEERITIVKLPAHITGKLQPLDVCCFGPLNMERGGETE